MYKTALFDLDDTLIKSRKLYDKSQRYVADMVSRKYSLDPQEFFEKLQSKYLVVSRNFPNVHTRHSRILVFRMTLDDMVSKYDLSLLPDIEDLYWEFFLDHIEKFPHVELMLTELRDHGFKIGIVSDGSLSLRIRKVKAAGLMPYIDEVIASEEVIFEKPFSAIFTLALSRLDAEAKETFMVGNNFKNDIRGAQLIGIKAGIYDPTKDANLEGQDGTIRPDFRVTDYSQLLDKVIDL